MWQRQQRQRPQYWPSGGACGAAWPIPATRGLEGGILRRGGVAAAGQWQQRGVMVTPGVMAA